MTADYPYPPDEFDVDPDGEGPRGAHREPETRRHRWWPLVAVLVGFPLLAFLLVTWLSDWEGLPGSDAPPAAEETQGTATPGATTTPAPTEPAPGETTPAPQETEPAPEETEPAVEADLSLDVAVLNATTTSGLAGGAAERLADAGFTSTSPGNWDGAAVQGSTVFFAEGDDVAEATALAAAAELSIDRVQSSGTLDVPVTVVLETDYQP